MIQRNDPCPCGSGKKWKQCHYPNKLAPAAYSSRELSEHYRRQYGILIKNSEQIAKIRAAGHVAAKILDELAIHATAGTTTEELDQLAVALHKKHGAIAAPLHYGSPPFPKSICTSINEVICHGIPGQETLQEGDIVNIDVTVILNGFFGDCSRMVCIGKVSEEKQRVVDTSYDALMASAAILKPGVPISAIGDAICRVAEARNCSVVYQFVGHGTGVHFHENPQVAHHRNGLSIPLVPGMIFTIEPMINAGVPEAVIDREDRWTARTKDGLPSAQWELMLLITEDGYENLTPWQQPLHTAQKGAPPT